MGCGKNKSENVNLVIQVEFLDTQNPFSKEDNRILAQAFNGSKNSLDNFIYLNSNGSRTLESKTLGVVKIDKPIDYFMPKYRYDEGSGEYKARRIKGGNEKEGDRSSQ